MKKTIVLAGLCALLATVGFAACDGEPTPPPAHTHTYVLHEEVKGTCAEEGTLAHYTCEGCDQLFDLMKREISSIAGEKDPTNHAETGVLTLAQAPIKTQYWVGETFDSAGMSVVYGCAACDGEALDNQFLTYTYQSGTAIQANDTKVTVSVKGAQLEVAITASKAQVEIIGVEAEYETSCGRAPTIEARASLPESEIEIAYFDGMLEVKPSEFTAGKTYLAVVSIAATETVNGAEARASVTVKHQSDWVTDKDDENVRRYQCGCGITEFSVFDNQTAWVDDVDMSVDLAKCVQGANTVSIKSIDQLLMANNDQKVAIDGVNTDMVYTFAKDKYEKLTENWTPYFLKLAIVYTVNGMDVPVTLTAKYVETVIRTANDLNKLAYTGASSNGEPNATMVTGMFVLANDIDASGVTLGGGNPCWQAAIGFGGCFEGNGYTVSNLTIGDWSQGLFGAIGYNGKVQNVTFKNVTLGEGSKMFAYMVRNGFLTDVRVEFNEQSKSFLVAESINATQCSNVSIKTKSGTTPFLIDEDDSNPLPATVTVEYFTNTASARNVYALPPKKKD